MQGVTAVRNELLVVPNGEAGADAPAEPPTVPEGPPAAAGALTGRAGTAGRRSAQPAATPGPLESAVTLGPPVAGPPSAPAQPRPPAELGRPVALPNDQRPATALGDRSPAADPSAAVEQLRQTDERFRRLRPEVRDSVVTVRGAVRRGEDLMAFAQAVSRLPGVERVVLTAVQVDVRR
jgi:hypothetical protein